MIIKIKIIIGHKSSVRSVMQLSRRRSAKRAWKKKRIIAKTLAQYTEARRGEKERVR